MTTTIALDPETVAELQRTGEVQLSAVCIKTPEAKAGLTNSEVKELADQIVEAYACELWQAQDVIRLLERAANHTRTHGYGKVGYKLTSGNHKNLEELLYRIMPDDTKSEDGSIHRMLEHALLRFDEGELEIIHTRQHGDCMMMVTITHVPLITTLRIAEMPTPASA